MMTKKDNAMNTYKIFHSATILLTLGLLAGACANDDFPSTPFGSDTEGADDGFGDGDDDGVADGTAGDGGASGDSDGSQDPDDSGDDGSDDDGSDDDGPDDGGNGQVELVDVVRLVSRTNDQCITLESASLDTGARLEFDQCADEDDPEPHQTLLVKPLEGEWTELEFDHSGLCLAVRDGSEGDVDFVQEECVGKMETLNLEVNRHRQFMLRDVGDGYINIVPRHTQDCAEIETYTHSNGLPWPFNDEWTTNHIRQRDCSENTEQEFDYVVIDQREATPLPPAEG